VRFDSLQIDQPNYYASSNALARDFRDEFVTTLSPHRLDFESGLRRIRDGQIETAPRMPGQGENL
jgi:hypothetical protein